MNKTLIIIFIFAFKLVSAQDSIPKSLIEYQKIDPLKVKNAYKLESPEHRLGRIAYYTYTPTGKLSKETGYENKEGKLVFYFEYGYRYDDRDSLIYEYKYTEIPSPKYPKLEETRYIYPSDSLTIKIRTFGENESDTTYFRTQKDNSGREILMSKIRKSTYRGMPKYKDVILIQNFYNDKNQLIKKIRTDKIYGDIGEYNFDYKEDKISTYSYKRKDYQLTISYENGLPIIEDSGYSDSERRIKLYQYNKKGKESLVKLYEDGKHTYSYASTYNKQGKRVRYDMIEEADGSSGVWLYEYDKSGKLIYKIDLYDRKPNEVHVVDTKQKKKENQEFTPFKRNKEDGLYGILRHNSDTVKVVLEEEPFLTYADFADAQFPTVDNWGNPSLEIILTDGGYSKYKEQISAYGNREIAFIKDKTVIHILRPEHPAKEKSILIKGNTLKNIFNIFLKFTKLKEKNLSK